MNASSLIQQRAAGACELCGSADALAVVDVAPFADGTPDHSLVLCGVCAPQVLGEAALDARHLYCLQQAIWSEVAPVQAVAWRLLNGLQPLGWAAELLDQEWLSDEVRALATAAASSAPSGAAANADAAVTRDSNGAVLADGDSVTIVKDLDVKGTSFVAKRGTTVRGIRLTSNPEHDEGRVNGVQIVLKTMFLK